jgi:acyl-CoA synthetase (AMP-forming)/AMP-acid ligase II
VSQPQRITGVTTKKQKSQCLVNGLTRAISIIVIKTIISTYCRRGDDMLKFEGIWVSPVEVENIPLAHPSVVFQVAVVGYRDKNDLIKPKAYIGTETRI